MARRSIFLVLLLLTPTVSFADTLTENFVLESRVLGEERPVQVELPDGYDPGGSYPVVYLLDGGEDWTSQVADDIHTVRPDLIIVGVANVDRTRDMFPDPVPAKQGRGGGGWLFLEFLTTELVPHVEKHFAAGGPGILVGQSNSGFFTLFAMIEAPEAFDAFLASSPMIGWDKDLIHQGTRSLFEGRDSFPKALFMNMGDDDYDHVTGFLPDYADLMKNLAPQDFRWINQVIEGGGHVPESTYREGIRFILGPVDRAVAENPASD